MNKPLSIDDLNELLETADAMVWAKKFVTAVQINPNIATDEETMLGWFANAIMTGFDNEQRRNQGQTIAMSEAENTTVVQKFLDMKLRLREQLDEAQKETRTALQLACESGTSQILIDLAIAISTIDKAWENNEEAIAELLQSTNIQFPVSDKIYSAAEYSGSEVNGGF